MDKTRLGDWYSSYQSSKNGWEGIENFLYESQKDRNPNWVNQNYATTDFTGYTDFIKTQKGKTNIKSK